MYNLFQKNANFIFKVNIKCDKNKVKNKCV